MAGACMPHVCQWIRCVTVEPVLFLYMFASSLTFSAFQAMTYDKCCLALYNETWCQELDSNKTVARQHSKETDAVQSMASHWMMRGNIAVTVPATVVLLLCLGSWGDRLGRRVPLAVPCVAAIVYSVSNLLNAHFMASPLAYTLIGPICSGLGGSYLAVLMAAYTYLTHLVDTGQRMVRVGVAESAVFLSSTISVFVSGLMVDNLGYVPTFGIILVFQTLALLYTLILLPEINTKRGNGTTTTTTTPTTTSKPTTTTTPTTTTASPTTTTTPTTIIPTTTSFSPTPTTTTISATTTTAIPPTTATTTTTTTTSEDDATVTWCWWCLEPLRDMWRFVRTARAARVQLHLALLILVLDILQLCTTGELDILMLYLKRSPRNWSYTTYGYFKGAENFTRGAAVLLLLPLLKKTTSARDTTLILVGLVSKMASLVLLGLAKETWLVFLVVGIASLQGFPSSGLRSLMSSLVHRDEQGRLFGLVAATESVVTFCATLIFNGIYPKTLHFYDGFCFQLAAGLVLICFFIVLFQHVDLKANRESLFHRLSTESPQSSSSSCVASEETTSVGISSSSHRLQPGCPPSSYFGSADPADPEKVTSLPTGCVQSAEFKERSR